MEVDEALVKIFSFASRLIYLELEPTRRPKQWWMDKFYFLRERHDQKELDIFVVFNSEPGKLQMVNLPSDYYEKKQQKESEQNKKNVPLVSWKPKNKPRPRM